MMPHLAAVLPEIVILVAACVVLIVDLFVPEERRAISYRLTQAALLLGIVVVVVTARIDPVRVFGGMVVDDMLADVLKLFALIAVSLTLAYVDLGRIAPAVQPRRQTGTYLSAQFAY